MSEKTKPAQRPLNHPISSRKQKAFRGFTLLFPIMILALSEGTLRLLDYGPDLDLFTKENHNGTEYCLINPDVASRYFSRIEFNPSTAPDYFLADKPDTTFRIFCLGGSTTAGFPYQFGGSFVSFLRDRLRAKFPERHIEVINLGMTATNSHTVLDLAEDLFVYEPDLLIVYDGHNEFYGALGLASHETLGSARWLVRVYLKLVHVRLFLLLRDAYTAVAGMFRSQVNVDISGTMMERLARGQYVRYGSEQYRRTLETFIRNLEEVKELCARHHVPVMIGSQVSNLRDQAPFVSEPSEELTARERNIFDMARDAGRKAQRAGDFTSATEHYRTALAMDSLRADIHYFLAQCYDSLDRANDALQEYIRARDYDMLRFRASSDFNTAMRNVADGHSMFFVDIERKFKANTADSLVGNSLITEHLHPNTRGNFLIAKEYQWMMHWHEIMATRDEWNERAGTSDDLLWNERTVTELDERAAQRRVQLLTAGWPFTEDDLPVPPVPQEDTLAVIVDEWVHGNLNWEQAHVLAAAFHERRGDVDNEIREYRTLMKLLPLNVSPYLFLAKAYLKKQRNQEAASVLLQSLQVEKTWFALKTLGVLAVDPPVAASFFGDAVEVSSDDGQRVEALYLLATSLARDHQREAALHHLRLALETDPDYVPARELMKILSPVHQ